MIFPKYRINVQLLHAIDQTGPCPRIAGLIHEDGMLTCYMLGAEKFKWNPETDEIILFPPYLYQGAIVIDEFKIDTNLCKTLYNIELGKKKFTKKEDEYKEIKNELGITKRTLNEKDKEQIRKYQNVVPNKANRQKSSSKEIDSSTKV